MTPLAGGPAPISSAPPRRRCARAGPERGMGNCMFCAVSSGINTWLSSI